MSSCVFAGFFEAVLNPQRNPQLFLCRQMAARCCQDALRASKTKEEVYHVLRLMVRLSDDIGKQCTDRVLRNLLILEITQYASVKYPENSF